MEAGISLGKVIAIVKAMFHSPALSGTPTAPTPEPGTDNNQIATTAFVNQAIESSGEDLIGRAY